jgi:hypothetical protein
VSKPSKAGRFADAAEAAGWTVERLSPPGEHGTDRQVIARRGDEAYSMQWFRTVDGEFNFEEGWHRAPWLEEDEPANNVAAALRAMEKPAPTDLNRSTDGEVTSAVVGHRITWINSLSGLEETAYVDKIVSIQVRTESLTRRIITFTSPEGFRSVSIDAIVRVR